MNSSRMAPEVPAVAGGTELIAKQSTVDEQGGVRCLPIGGVSFRPTRPVPHEDGHVAEVARADWEIVGGPIVQVHTTTTFPGRIRAWGLHQRSTDRLFVAEGLVQIVVFDGRDGSPTFGRVNVFTVSPKNPGLLVIGPNLYHGWKNIGTNEAIIINMPTSMYHHDSPDALDLPYGSEAAQRIVPFQW
jgi:dTDP-4-dehydrorhamnose 3,5-epimerase